MSSSPPVVLIAEELSPATIEALGPDFEVRHCNGADRADLLAAVVDVDAILVRSATAVDAEVLARRALAEGRGPRRRGPGQRRRPGRHPGRCDGRQRADVEHRLGRRAGHRPAARDGPEHRRGRRLAQGRCVEAQPVQRRRAVREDGRHRRAGPDRRAGRAAPVGVRHGAGRVRPVRLARPRGPARRPPGRTGRAAAGERLHHRAPAAHSRDGRADRRGGPAPGEADGADRQRRARRDRRRGRPRGGPGRGAGRRGRSGRLRDRADDPVAAVRPRVGRGHPAPRSVDRRGAGAGRGRRGPQRAAGARRRAGPGRGQRRRGRHRRGRPPGDLAGREARPHLHRAGRAPAHDPRRRGAR